MQTTNDKLFSNMMKNIIAIENTKTVVQNGGHMLKTIMYNLNKGRKHDKKCDESNKYYMLSHNLLNDYKHKLMKGGTTQQQVLNLMKLSFYIMETISTNILPNTSDDDKNVFQHLYYVELIDVMHNLLSAKTETTTETKKETTEQKIHNAKTQLKHIIEQISINKHKIKLPLRTINYFIMVATAALHDFDDLHPLYMVVINHEYHFTYGSIVPASISASIPASIPALIPASIVADDGTMASCMQTITQFFFGYNADYVDTVFERNRQIVASLKRISLSSSPVFVSSDSVTVYSITNTDDKYCYMITLLYMFTSDISDYVSKTKQWKYVLIMILFEAFPDLEKKFKRDKPSAVSELHQNIKQVGKFMFDDLKPDKIYDTTYDIESKNKYKERNRLLVNQTVLHVKSHFDVTRFYTSDALEVFVPKSEANFELIEFFIFVCNYMTTILLPTTGLTFHNIPLYKYDTVTTIPPIDSYDGTSMYFVYLFDTYYDTRSKTVRRIGHVEPVTIFDIEKTTIDVDKTSMLQKIEKPQITAI
jgi:hypothetical protein